MFASAGSLAQTVLECHGSKSSDTNVQVVLTLLETGAAKVVVTDNGLKQACGCQFGYDGYFDQSAGVVPGYVVDMKHRTCEASCPQRFKQMLASRIRVQHRPLREESYVSAFVDGEIAPCAKFSIDVPALRRLDKLSNAVRNVPDSPR